MAELHIFVGPSCLGSLILAVAPAAILHGPVKHGDLFAPEIAEGDTALIVDGSYHHRLALRHKEIIDAMERGVRVTGAASIGALRAAELAEIGMVGVGRIYEWYRDGIFDGDDAVAVAHAETDSPTGVNVPLVNLYASVLAAQEQHVVDSPTAARLMDVWQAEYYPGRTAERVLTLASEIGERTFADWCRASWAREPAAFDQKRADTLNAADAEMRHESAVPPLRLGARDWRTDYHRRWRSRFATDGKQPPPYLRVAYQQLFSRDFPEVWSDYLHQVNGPEAFTDHVRRTLGVAAEGWRTDPFLRDRVATFIRPLPDLGDPRQLAMLLAAETADDRDTAEDWLDVTRSHLADNPGRSLTHISDAACTQLLSEIWAEPSPAAECGRRGLLSLRQAAVALRPFSIGYLAHRVSRGESSHV